MRNNWWYGYKASSSYRPKSRNFQTSRLLLPSLVAPYRAILRYYCCDTLYRAMLSKGAQHSPKIVPYPPWYLVSHRHICAIPHFATYRAIIMRYPMKTSTKDFLRYYRYKYRAISKVSLLGLSVSEFTLTTGTETQKSIIAFKSLCQNNATATLLAICYRNQTKGNRPDR